VRPIATLEPWRPGLSSPALPRTSSTSDSDTPCLWMRCPSLRIDVKAKSHVLSQPPPSQATSNGEVERPGTGA
jgi:hypothetical protein